MSTVNNSQPVTAETFAKLHDNMLTNFDKAIKDTEGNKKFFFFGKDDNPELRKQLEDARTQASQIIIQMMEAIGKAAQLDPK